MKLDLQLVNRLSREVLASALISALATVLSACRVGGGVTASSSAAAPAAALTAPIIVLPAVTPFYSKNAQLSLSGICAPDAAVFLTGSSTDQTKCIGGVFAFTVAKLEDGIYTFIVTQNAGTPYYSNPAALVWYKKSSVPPPILSYPTTNPFYSGLSSINITGSCETGNKITLSGDGAGSATCANAQFSITLPKAADGDYNITVNQTDPAGNTANIAFQWRRHSLIVTPTNPSLIVNTPQPISITGGSGTYTVTTTTNNSGGTYFEDLNTVPPTRVYTPGPLAGVTDVLTVTDTFGNSIPVTVTTNAGAPDHFVLPGSNHGDNQTAFVGSPYANPLRVKVADMFGNGIGQYPVFFQTMSGDATFTSDQIQLTDPQGFASVNVRAGLGSVLNKIAVTPVGNIFADVAGSGNSTMTFTEITMSKNTGGFGSTFTVGANPLTTVVSDFNKDGYPDVAVLNTRDSKVGILINNGRGGLMAMTQYSICTGPNNMVSGVFDKSAGKTDLDLMVICSGSTHFSLLRGNGDGTFKPQIQGDTQPSQPVTTFIAAGDFNHDGKLDFAVTSAGASVVGIYIGDGVGGFTAGPEYYVTDLTPTSIRTINISKSPNGAIDLIVTNAYNNKVAVLKNNGNGTFATPYMLPVGIGPLSSVVADLNNDGYDDFATVNDEGTVSIYLNDKFDTFNQGATVGVGTNPNAIAAAFFDPDTNVDLVVTNNSDSTVTVIHGYGDGSFNADTPVATINSPVYISVADLDKDNYQDLVITGVDPVIQVLQGQSNGKNFGLVATTGNTPSGAVFADFDGDGNDDVAIINKDSNTTTVLKGAGNGFFTPLTPLVTGGNPSAILAGDFNKDGKIDLAIINQASGTLNIYIGKGDGSFETAVVNPVTAGPRAMVMADFDRDGWPDLVVVGGGVQTVSVLINAKSTSGTFLPRVNYSVGNAATSIAVGDFNGDKKLDIAVANPSSDTVYSLLGNGDGTFQGASGTVLNSGAGPSLLASADLNNDGNSDVIAANGSDRSITIMLGRSDGAFGASPLSYDCGNAPSSIVLGDFNKDGKLDVAVTNPIENTFSVVKGFGNGTFVSTPTTYPVNVSIGVMTTGDFNKDNALDLILLDTFNARAFFWQGQ